MVMIMVMITTHCEGAAAEFPSRGGGGGPFILVVQG